MCGILSIYGEKIYKKVVYTLGVEGNSIFNAGYSVHEICVFG